jgi:glycosyltransferase involved in cell wall biosynthesis
MTLKEFFAIIVQICYTGSAGPQAAWKAALRLTVRRILDLKLLSIAIPCYNSAAYMENCINSLLPGGDEVEILIVDDGSVKDNTAEIADRYEKEYPGICRAIHQENGGHGEAVNAGLRNASGIFFKVVDSDDWVNGPAYEAVLNTLRRFVYGKSTLDMLITNFVYEKQGAKHKKVMNYNMALPKNELFTWDDVKVFMAGQYILMHSVIYRTELLRECGLELPKHTFYVDNIFVYEPLPHVRSMYYLDVNFYRYFIGRSDQSVNEQVMIGRIDQQIRVTKLMLGYYDVTKLQNRKLRHYMIRYLEIMMVVSSILAIRSETEENLEKKKELWEHVKKTNPRLYLRLRFGFLGQGMNLPGKSGRTISIAGYKIAQKFFGFN